MFGPVEGVFAEEAAARAAAIAISRIFFLVRGIINQQLRM